jgi:hypothetical protein
VAVEDEAIPESPPKANKPSKIKYCSGRRQVNCLSHVTKVTYRVTRFYYFLKCGPAYLQRMPEIDGLCKWQEKRGYLRR